MLTTCLAIRIHVSVFGDISFHSAKENSLSRFSKGTYKTETFEKSYYYVDENILKIAEIDEMMCYCSY